MKKWNRKQRETKNLHIMYHLKNLFRLGILVMFGWIELNIGGLMFVPHIAGFFAGNLRITYESTPLDIVIWGFCTLFAVGLLFAGAIYLMVCFTRLWNSLFSKTMAEKAAIKRQKELQFEKDKTEYLKQFGISEEIVRSSCKK